MSSEAARTAIMNAVTATALPWPTYDLSDYLDMEGAAGGVTDTTLLVQFVASDDQMMNIAGEGNQGWEETGTAVLHALTPVGFDSDPIIQKCDLMRQDLRGTRHGSVVIESCTPFMDFGGGNIGIEGAFKSFSATLFYYNRDCG